MNREKKFRAWYKKSSCWVFLAIDKGFAAEVALEIYREINLNGGTWYEFTGLKDKNGKEIYEGDVNQDNGVVIWNSDDASFCWHYNGIETSPMGEESEWAEVIGNIYEHPELLNK